MDRKKSVMMCFVIVIAVIVLVIGAAVFGDSKDGEQDVNIYFLNPLTNEIYPENRIVQSFSDVGMVEKVLNEMLGGPKNTSLINAIPNDVGIIKCTLITGGENGNVAEVNFSSEYGDMKESQELLCRAAIVWTLTDLEFIDAVSILVDGKPLMRTNNEEVGVLDRENVVVNPVISPEKTETRTVTLYFSNEQATSLCAETRNIEVKQSLSLETQIVEQLIAGPSNANMYPTVPTETKIRNIKTEENICYVDLSSEFVSKHSGGSSAETLTIYSIVNSLTELSVVKKVQFLIEGEKVNEFKGHIDFSKPFERNESIVTAVVE